MTAASAACTGSDSDTSAADSTSAASTGAGSTGDTPTTDVTTGDVPKINGCDAASAMDLTAMAAVEVQFGGTIGTMYEPKCFRVKAGTAVTFTGSLGAHPLQGGVVADGMKMPDDASPLSPVSDTGMSKVFTLAAAGEFGFYCVKHALTGMNGAVFVE